MKLNFAVLTFELGRRIPLVSMRGSKDRALSLPLLYRRGMVLEGSNLYIAQSSSLPKKMPSNFAGTLVCSGSLPASWSHEKICLITVAPELKLSDLYNHVRAVFTKFYEWDASMQEIWESEGTIQELLDVSSPILDNMLVLTDQGSNVLAGSFEGHHCTSGKYVDIVNSDMTLKNLAAKTRQIAPTIYVTDLGDYMDAGECGAPFSIMVKRIHEPSHSIVVSLAVRPENRPVGEQDCWMLNVLALYIKRVFPRSSKDNDRIEADIINALLKKEPVEAEKLDLLFLACDAQKGNQLRCVLIAKPPYVLDSALSYLRQRFKVVVPKSAVAVFGDFFVIVLNDTRSGWDKPSLREWICSWLGDRNDSIGLSNEFDDLSLLSEYYQEALAAHGFAEQDPDNILLFSECSLEYVLDCCTGGLQQQRLFPVGLHRLLNTSSSSSVDYVATLRTWLDEGMNDNQAAKKLHISRNAFLYRRDRLLSILDVNIEDPETRFYLSLCLRLLEAANPSPRTLG